MRFQYDLLTFLPFRWFGATMATAFFFSKATPKLKNLFMTWAEGSRGLKDRGPHCLTRRLRLRSEGEVLVGICLLFDAPVQACSACPRDNVKWYRNSGEKMAAQTAGLCVLSICVALVWFQSNAWGSKFCDLRHPLVFHIDTYILIYLKISIWKQLRVDTSYRRGKYEEDEARENLLPKRCWKSMTEAAKPNLLFCLLPFLTIEIHVCWKLQCSMLETLWANGLNRPTGHKWTCCFRNKSRFIGFNPGPLRCALLLLPKCWLSKSEFLSF